MSQLPTWLAPLPAAWAQQPQWRVLDVSGSAAALLTIAQARRADPLAPQRLHYVLVLPTPEALQASAPAAWQAQLRGLLPGVHRLALEDGLLLTLWLGEPQRLLRQQTLVADTLLLGSDTACWSGPHGLKPLLRHCQRGSQLLAPAAESASTAFTHQLQHSGWRCTSAAAAGALHAQFDPPWPLRKAPPPAAVAGTALVIGAGLAGSSAAFSLAQRGWQVTVLAAGPEPADGASGLPAGLFCPHTSPDDCALSRLSRAGLQTLLPRLQALCTAGQDWQASGVLEHDSTHPPQLAWRDGPGLAWSRPASAAQCQAAGLPDHAPALWHERAGWLRPAALVAAQLQHPRIRFQGSSPVAQLLPQAHGWQALGAQGQPLAQADIAIIAAGPASRAWLPWPLQPLRGQVTWGPRTADNSAALPPFPVNGCGNLVPHVPHSGNNQDDFWIMGSTFERGITQLPPSLGDQASAHAHNLGHLQQLLPASAAQLTPWFTPGNPANHPTWARVRVASHDRLPIVGPVPGAAPGLWALTALGARGITLAALCGELLAARLHAEPLPLEAALAGQLGSERLQPH